MKRLVLLLLLLCSMPGQACLWSSGTSVDGREVGFQDTFPVTWTDRRKAQEYRKQELSEIFDKVQSDPTNRDYQNDYGVALARVGRVEEALQIFRKLESEIPDQYQTAANLGTVLELAGDNEAALEWIQEAIRRNPNAHRGTEWVHVRVLEAKLACAKDPRWLETHGVLGLRFGDEGKPQRLGRLTDDKELFRIAEDIRYQLKERTSLVSPPDLYVGDLMFDLTNLTAFTHSVERAMEVMEETEIYGTSRRDLLKRRKDYFLSLLAKNGSKPEALESATPAATPEPSTTPAQSDKEPSDQTMLPIILAPVALVLTLATWQRRRRRST